ncbi:hypothetical protein [Massilia sp. CCM 8734]|uniref:hypothetical protein n=1 Tax=Massilia sp. CCM 8734 TaxID=2609283 RepID=UPI00141FD174|nr:hypothetical protein [Massilia sp. CCM 8734]NHZ94745.1 hypothetical protein [Massilia sp. CCM 8734]
MMGLLLRHRALAASLATLAVLLATCTALLAGNSYWHPRFVKTDDRLLTVSNALSPSNLLPRTYIARIQASPGVASVTEYSSVALFLANERQVFTGAIVDKDRVAATFPRLGADSATLARWQQRRDAVLVSAALLKKQQLAVGNMVAARLFSGDAESNQEFYIAGTFGADNELKCTTCVMLGRDFADLALPTYRAVVASFHVRLREHVDKAQARRALDTLFAHDTPATRSTDFLPAASGFMNDLIDLRQLVYIAFCMTLAAALLLPALCSNMLALHYRTSLALLLVVGQRKLPLLFQAMRLALAAGLLIGAGGFVLAFGTGSYLFDKLLWLRIEVPTAALQAAAAAGTLVALSAWTAVSSVIARLDVNDLFSDTLD